MQRTKLKVGDEVAYVEWPRSHSWLSAVKVRVIAIDGITIRGTSRYGRVPAVRVELVDPPTAPTLNDRGLIDWDTYDGGYQAYRAKCPNSFSWQSTPPWTADVKAVHLLHTWEQQEADLAAKAESDRRNAEEAAKRKVAEQAHLAELKRLADERKAEEARVCAQIAGLIDADLIAADPDLVKRAVYGTEPADVLTLVRGAWRVGARGYRKD